MRHLEHRPLVVSASCFAFLKLNRGNGGGGQLEAQYLMPLVMAQAGPAGQGRRVEPVRNKQEPAQGVISPAS
jgi:hypothetical protein